MDDRDQSASTEELQPNSDEDFEIEPPLKSVKAYDKAVALSDKPEFYKSGLSTQAAINRIHREVTGAVNWSALKRDAPTEESRQLAEQSQAFQQATYRDVIRVRAGEQEEDPSYLEPESVSEAMSTLASTMDRLIADCPSDSEDLVGYVLASWAYMRLEAIHPFVVANGRTGELLMDLVCRRTGKQPFRINHDKGRLDNAFNKCPTNPIFELLKKPRQKFIEEIRTADLETVLSDPNSLSFTLGLLETQAD